jgi:hypothetical protein
MLDFPGYEEKPARWLAAMFIPVLALFLLGMALPAGADGLSFRADSRKQNRAQALRRVVGAAVPCVPAASGISIASGMLYRRKSRVSCLGPAYRTHAGYGVILMA